MNETTKWPLDPWMRRVGLLIETNSNALWVFPLKWYLGWSMWGAGQSNGTGHHYKSLGHYLNQITKWVASHRHSFELVPIFKIGKFLLTVCIPSMNQKSALTVLSHPQAVAHPCGRGQGGAASHRTLTLQVTRVPLPSVMDWAYVPLNPYIEALNPQYDCSWRLAAWRDNQG